MIHAVGRMSTDLENRCEKTVRAGRVIAQERSGAPARGGGGNPSLALWPREPCARRVPRRRAPVFHGGALKRLSTLGANPIAARGGTYFLWPSLVRLVSARHFVWHPVGMGGSLAAFDRLGQGVALSGLPEGLLCASSCLRLCTYAHVSYVRCDSSRM